MSGPSNNAAYRQQELKRIIMKLHDGATVDEVKAEFADLTVGVSAVEITQMEQQLVNEGLPVEEIQRLCDVHASVFKGSIAEIHAADGSTIDQLEELHPIQVFKKENRQLELWIEKRVMPAVSRFAVMPGIASMKTLRDALNELWAIDLHYKRKEHLIFPLMEKHGITAPPQVMWGVDDEIRSKLKQAIALLDEDFPDAAEVKAAVVSALDQLREMIFKEEQIMLPMVWDAFSHQEWVAVSEGSPEIGYTLLDEVPVWQPKNIVMPSGSEVDTEKSTTSGQSDKTLTSVHMDAGSLTPEEINRILNTVPFDMTFVDANDRVKYFTQGKERIFDRPKTIIGREVKNCHPPKSVHVVEQIVADLKSGKKDHEDFWIRLGDKFVHIRYFAVRGDDGTYLGTLEVSQDIKPIQALVGEKRLVSESL